MKISQFIAFAVEVVGRYDSVDQLILFGSCARGENVVGSDVDLAIISETMTRKERAEIRMLLSEPGVNFDLVLVSPSTLSEEQGDLVFETSIRKEGLILYDKEKGNLFINSKQRFIER